MRQERVSVVFSLESIGITLWLVFLILKCTHVVDWNWFWVWFPLWLPLAIDLVVILVVLVMLAFATRMDKWHD